MGVLDHVEKCFIGRGDRTLEIPHDNPNDIGLDQAPDLRFQPSCQFTDFCFRLFALSHLECEVVYVYKSLVRRGGGISPASS